jgi:hypothetical protein
MCIIIYGDKLYHLLMVEWLWTCFLGMDVKGGEGFKVKSSHLHPKFMI